jgi:hypothetical protein
MSATDIDPLAGYPAALASCQEYDKIRNVFGTSGPAERNRWQESLVSSHGDPSGLHGSEREYLTLIPAFPGSIAALLV